MQLSSEKKFRYPWRNGNRFDLMIDGDRFYPAMLDDIAAAQHTILLELYLFESGQLAERFITALEASAERGVAIYLLLDDFGARKLDSSDRQRLGERFQVCYYNPLHYGRLRRNLFRDHRKLLLIDGQTAYTGGAGVTDLFDPALEPEHYWHEVMVRIEGPVTADWHALFAKNWQRSHGQPLPLALPTPANQSTEQRGRVTTAQPTRLELRRSAVTQIRNAEQRVWLATAYFMPPWMIRRVLRHAAQRGCDVRLLLPGPQTDHPGVRHAGRRFYARLLRRGVRIYEYQPRFLHAKLMLCDDWASIGSSNIDRWNLRWNLEANQEVEDTRFCNEMAALFEADFLDSNEITYSEWQQRSLYGRLQEWFWGKVDGWLDRHTLRKGKRPEK